MRAIHRLSATRVERVKKPGLYADGGGLYLQVIGGAKSWILRYDFQGRRREMGLGPLRDVGLAGARQQAARWRHTLKVDRRDPLEAREAERLAERLRTASAVTFKEAAGRYIEAHRPSWRNDKHAGQWETTLTTYAYPVLAALPVADVQVGHVLKVLEPIWTVKPETAGRVRGRIEAVLDWAAARGYRAGDNPARWRGHLEKLLPARSKVRSVAHHAALPFAEVGAFVADLRDREGTSARALEFLILTAARTGEIIGAKWPEIDLDAKVWTIPGARMKAGREHRVPLSVPAVALLKRIKESGAGDHVFPGGSRAQPLSNMALLQTLERMGRRDLTVHGFRSTFRDWAAERTNFPREIAEAALAHTLKDKTEAAYRRGDALEKRRRLMEAWARFCDAKAPAGGKLVSLAG